MPDNNTLELDRKPAPSGEADDFSAPDEKTDKRAKNHEIELLRVQMGPIGGLIGSTDSSKTIAFITVCLCLVFMAVVFFVAFDREAGAIPHGATNTIALLGSIILGCIGFIFGTKDK